MTSALNRLLDLPACHDRRERVGMASICSAHPLVIEATLREAAPWQRPVLFEATCNQVNQDGGYTGMTPIDFRQFVQKIAGGLGFSDGQIVLGGDHLGPNPWRHLHAEKAMDKALTMTRDYAAAGFAKIHLDASMACADDGDVLSPEVIAKRSAELASAAESGARDAGHHAPAYVIGTEVPVPGGAAEILDQLEITQVSDAQHTLNVHRQAFADKGLSEVFDRVIAIVVQPGVEFGSVNVVDFQSDGAVNLANWRDRTTGILFEAHSTDYQSPEALAAMVQAGFGILKVGPGLTHAMREALYGLDAIAAILDPDYPKAGLVKALEAQMLRQPDHWKPYYHGDETQQYIQRHYSYSDRIRYYWAEPAVQQAVSRLFTTLQGREIPAPLISQYFARQYGSLRKGTIAPSAHDVVMDAVKFALTPYSNAC